MARASTVLLAAVLAAVVSLRPTGAQSALENLLLARETEVKLLAEQARALYQQASCSPDEVVRTSLHVAATTVPALWMRAVGFHACIDGLLLFSDGRSACVPTTLAAR